ncbi:SDR family NAD(P)-dependent oxidoreductase [Nocardia asiatica]|uniref:SDR family NAD(P)-dependent oxidoreductase n=1 Tax=Nocardia asiatica TaxID=209252 RepID=UPI003EE2B3DE
MVTGASRGIGKGIALELGAAGATVFVTGRSAAQGRLPGTVHATAADMMRRAASASRSCAITATTTRWSGCSSWSAPSTAGWTCS